MHNLDNRQSVLRVTLKHDRVIHFNEVAVRAAAAAAAGDSKQLYACAREIAPRKRKPPQAVVLEDGARALRPFDVRTRWQQFFSLKVAGCDVSAEQLLEAYVTRQASNDSSRESLHLLPSAIPTEADIRDIITAGKRGTGFGEDSIPVEVYLITPFLFAALLWPLWLKAVLRLEHPLA